MTDILKIGNTFKISFSAFCSTAFKGRMHAEGRVGVEGAYLQCNVLQQCVFQHSLQLPVDLQRQVQGQPAVRRV